MTNKLTQATELLTEALKEITADNAITNNGKSIDFNADSQGANYGKGLMWKGHGPAKQFILVKGDKFLSTESLELTKDNSFYINDTPVLSETSIGNSVVKSNLRELGRLKNLVVDGNVNIGQYIYYNSISSRLGLGTDAPNSALSVSEDGVEIMLGTYEGSRARIGTFASNDIDIVTDNTPRITIEGGGNIKLGNKAFGPVQVSVHGKLSVGVKTMDTRADVHVAGAIKFNDRLHQYLNSAPDSGTYERGSIVWNSEADINRPVGWICVRAGSPGTWLPFGTVSQN